MVDFIESSKKSLIEHSEADVYILIIFKLILLIILNSREIGIY